MIVADGELRCGLKVLKNSFDALPVFASISVSEVCEVVHHVEDVWLTSLSEVE